MLKDSTWKQCVLENTVSILLKITRGRRSGILARSPCLSNFCISCLTFLAFFLLKLSTLYCDTGINKQCYEGNREWAQPYIYMCPLSPKFPSHTGCSSIEHCSICYNRSLLVIHFQNISVYVHAKLFLTIPSLQSSHPLQSPQHKLVFEVCECKFIAFLFRFHIKDMSDFSFSVSLRSV